MVYEALMAPSSNKLLEHRMQVGGRSMLDSAQGPYKSLSELLSIHLQIPVFIVLLDESINVISKFLLKHNEARIMFNAISERKKPPKTSQLLDSIKHFCFPGAKHN